MAANDLKQSAPTKTKSSRSNKAVQGTNDSSVRSKWSAAIRGYFTDEYLTDICRSEVFPNGQSSCVRAPVINRGYWVRVHAVNHVVTSFLDSFTDSSICSQVISLGAGYDSTFFRLASLGHMKSCCYIEVDFPELLTKKLEVLRNNERLSAFFPSFDQQCPAQQSSSRIIFESPHYKLIGADLTDLKTFGNLLKAAGIDFAKPTLFLSEVVLVYLNADRSSEIIQWAADNFRDSVFVTYEQVYPDDAFGTFMCRHFKNIGTALKSVNEFPAISSHVKRYCSRGWTETVASDMNYFFNNIVPSSERLRIDAIEMFDEYEEWHLKCAHYVLVTAFKGICVSLKDVIWSPSSAPSPFSLEVSHNSFTSEGITEVDFDGLLAFNSVSDLVVAKPVTTLTQIDAVCSTSEPIAWNRAFGHRCHLFTISGKRTIFVAGGFGVKQLDAAHRRMDSGSIISADHLDRHFEIPLFQSMYSMMTPISNNEVVIFGGRTSPGKPTRDVFLLRLEDSDVVADKFTTCLNKMVTSDHGPCPRWRHSATFVEHQGSPTIVVFGGRSNDQKFLNDCWMLNCNTWKWEEVHMTGDVPCARHTHTSEVWRSQILVICGLGSNQTPLSTIHVLNMTTFSWHRLPIRDNALLPRYSHTSVIHGDRLILVGGVSLAHDFSPVSIVDLMNGTTVNFDLKIPPEAFPTMLHNHAAVCLEKGDEQISLMLVGGGGNCFSFGTHLNDFPLTVNIPCSNVTTEQNASDQDGKASITPSATP